MSKIKYLFLSLVTLCMYAGLEKAHGQTVSLDLLLDPSFENAQTLSPSSLGIDTKGKGKKIVDIIIRNESELRQENLYIFFRFEGARFGTIIEMVQEAGKPFSLAPFQIVVTDNNRIQDGLPGIQETINLSALTDNSQNFINSMGGSTTLPDDVYSFVAELRQGGNTSEFTKSTLKKSFGVKPVVQTVDLFLLQPGGIVGSESQISSTLPLFRWDGPVSKEYRIVVVKDIKQSPEALIQQAISTSPTLKSGRQTGEGSLLEFEMMDALVQGSSFNVPVNGTQKLKAGDKYFWQVFTLVQSGSGTSYQPSAIWEFIVVDQKESSNENQVREVFENLGPILKGDRLIQLKEKGFTVSQITIDGKTVTGLQSILTELETFNQKIKDKKVTVNQ
jgi:hypothetical protein